MSQQDQYDTGDAKTVKSAQKKADWIAKKFERGIQHICNDEDARYVINQFFEQAGVFHPDRVIPTPDHQYEHGRDAGRRQMGLWWLTNMLLHDPMIISKLQGDEFSPLQQAKEE